MKAPQKALLLLMVLFVSLAAGAEGSAQSTFRLPVPPEVASERDARWAIADGLLAEGRLHGALPVIEAIKQSARGRGNTSSWTLAWVRELQITISLEGYEGAIEKLGREEWPQEPGYQAILELYRVHSILRYWRLNRWAIGRRTIVKTKAVKSLEDWTREEFLAEVNASFGRIWAQRQDWGEFSIDPLQPYLQDSDYPEHVRGTLRDTVTYLWVEFLSDKSFWGPQESQKITRVDVAQLLGPNIEQATPTASSHPLEVIAYLLRDLESWHRRADRSEAAFEASRSLLEIFHSNIESKSDRRFINAELNRRLKILGPEKPWWSMGMSLAAQFARAEKNDPTFLIRAREIALEGLKAHPESLGGQSCAAVVDSIEAPNYTLDAMGTDGPRKRSIEVEYSNLEWLYFRAWRMDLSQKVGRQDFFQNAPKSDPDVRWSEGLTPTRDYRNHVHFVTPPLEDPGLWVVQASADPSFGEENNKLQTLNLIISHIVVEVRPRLKSMEVTVRRGEDGSPLAEVQVELWLRGASERYRRWSSGLSNAKGRIVLSTVGFDWGEYFVLVKNGEDTALAMESWSYLKIRESATSDALVFMDRSIYRPGQTILWKIVACRGHLSRGDLKVLAKAKGEVKLFDATGEHVATKKVTTNDFGSASGTFLVEPGRALGEWSVETSWGSEASLQVEEYKRPTFQLNVRSPTTVMRLNQKASLEGRASYYFGAPLTEGEVEWRITRTPIASWWSYWRGRNSGSEVVASGKAPLNQEGNFAVEFTPEAPEEKEGENLHYRFEIEAELTNLGGETRSANRSFRVGSVSVETALEFHQSFGVEGTPFLITAQRTDLNGVPSPGEATWSLHRLEQPNNPAMPSEWPVTVGDKEEPWATPGDRLTERWYEVDDLTEAWDSWALGPRVDEGKVTHDSNGQGEILLLGLTPGVYWLCYETQDSWGGEFEIIEEFLVVSPEGSALPIPAYIDVETTSVEVGDSARLLVGSAFEGQEVVLEIFQDEERRSLRVLEGGALEVLEIPIRYRDRGGLTARITMVRDFQLLQHSVDIEVPWSDRKLDLEFATFRDRLRPGQQETWTVTVRDSDTHLLTLGGAEVLASMADRSLEFFRPYRPPRVEALYRSRFGSPAFQTSLRPDWLREQTLGNFAGDLQAPKLAGAKLILHAGFTADGLNKAMSQFDTIRDSEDWANRGEISEVITVTARAPIVDTTTTVTGMSVRESEDDRDHSTDESRDSIVVGVRQNFSETAFFYPHLLLEEDGSVAFEFEVPDSVTEWKVWVHALTKDLQGGSTSRETKTVKELLVRPYLPRFLRQGDRAEIEVVVSNTGEEILEGDLDFALFDPETEEDLGELFGLEKNQQTFRVKSGGSTSLRFGLQAPVRLGEVAIRATARAGAYSDGEQRAIPVLPSRLHLVQSRFAALQDEAMRTLRFADLRGSDDPSLLNEKLVVTLDGQLFYTVLQALPYLVDYPYECTEQTLNRFLSTAIVNSVFEDYPQVAKMALSLAERDTQLEAFDEPDPNRTMLLEESPWLMESRGGEQDLHDLVRVLDPKVARAQQRESLKKLEKVQTSLGGFPWWPGGPPSPYMTLYLLNGFSRAIEFGVDVPQSTVQRAWSYLHRHYIDEIAPRAYKKDCCWETITFLNYILSAYPDASWTGGVFSEAEREKMLDFSFKHWKKHSPLLKGYLALTLHRKGRVEDARLVFDSVMDSAKTDRDLGTYWAPEDRAWLWYNDTIESHAFTLRVLSELNPEDERRQGIVQWIMLDKKLSHWKSTRATAEVIYSLVHFLEQEDQLGVREEILVEVGDHRRTFVFEPDEYTGKKNQWTFEEQEITPDMGTITVEKDTPGLLFASATWHFSTEKLPEKGEGDFFNVDRIYFRRVHNGKEWTLRPLRDGETIEVGDQLEVQLSLRTKHAAEYVHLRDPRGAGFEPETLTSGFRWQTGLGYYEEVRDSGANFFFEWLPVGEYTFKYRLRAATAGKFRVGPATVQSMYAPEFAAYSGGHIVEVKHGELIHGQE